MGNNKGEGTSVKFEILYPLLESMVKMLHTTKSDLIIKKNFKGFTY